MNDNQMMKKLFLGSLAAMTLSILAMSMSSTIDGVMIGYYLGSDAVAGYGIVSPLILFFRAVVGALSIGAINSCVRAIGKGEKEKAESTFSSIAYLGIGFGIIVMLVCMTASSQVIHMLGGKGDIFELSKAYMFGWIIGLPAYMGQSITVQFAHLNGRKSLSVITIVVMSVVDILGNMANVFVFHGGLFGMGVASAVSYYASFVILIVHFLKKKNIIHFVRPQMKWSEMKGALWSGFPVIIQRGCQTLMIYCLNKISFGVGGVAAVSAFSIRYSMGGFFESVSIGCGNLIILMIGIFYGEKNDKEIKRTYLMGLRYCICIQAGVGILLFILAPFLTSLYINGGSDPVVEQYTLRALQTYAFSLPMNAILVVGLKYLQASGMMKLSMIMGVLREVLYIVVLAFTMSRFMGLEGIWQAFNVAPLLLILTYYIIVAVKKKKWRCNIADFTLLPPDMITPDEDCMELDIANKEDAVQASMSVSDFCRNHGADQKLSMRLALCTEELLCNIVMHGFQEKEKHYIRLRLIWNEGFTLTVRDDCAPFDIEKYNMIYNSDANTNIGIKLIFAMAKEVKYIPIMKLNTTVIQL